MILVALNSDGELYAVKESTQVKGGTMKEELAAQKPEKNALVKLVPADLSAHRRDEIDRMIAQRAYELFESRGWLHGHDVADWRQAEDEIVHGCRHDLREFPETIILRAEMPSSYRADPALSECSALAASRQRRKRSRCIVLGWHEDLHGNAVTTSLSSA